MSVVADIRNKTAQILRTNNVAGGKVFNSKVSPTFLSNMPAVLVYTESVIGTQLSPHTPTFTGSIKLQIEALVSMTATWADDVDNLVERVINTLMADTTWVSQFESIDGYTVEYSFFGDANAPLGMASIGITGKVFQAF